MGLIFCCFCFLIPTIPGEVMDLGHNWCQEPLKKREIVGRHLTEGHNRPMNLSASLDGAGNLQAAERTAEHGKLHRADANSEAQNTGNLWDRRLGF